MSCHLSIPLYPVCVHFKALPKVLLHTLSPSHRLNQVTALHQQVSIPHTMSASMVCKDVVHLGICFDSKEGVDDAC